MTKNDFSNLIYKNKKSMNIKNWKSFNEGKNADIINSVFQFLKSEGYSQIDFENGTCMFISGTGKLWPERIIDILKDRNPKLCKEFKKTNPRRPY